MRIRSEKGIAPVAGRGVVGLPQINYRLPLIVTTLAAVLIFLLAGLLAIMTTGMVSNYVTRPASEVGGDPVFIGCVCAPLGITFIGATLYFLSAVIKGVRDLLQPVHYTRGTVADREYIGGRKGANWLYVNARYAGPDLNIASEVTEEQRAASPDRTQIVQPRFASTAASPAQVMKEKQGSYLPAHRLTSDLKALDLPGPASTEPAILFRIDPVAHSAIKTDDEVLVAHSRHLQHVYYVSHLRGGEWETFPNKVLI